MLFKLQEFVLREGRVDDIFHKDETANTKDSPGMTRSGTKFSLTNQDCTNDNEKKRIGDRLNKWNEQQERHEILQFFYTRKMVVVFVKKNPSQ